MREREKGSGWDGWGIRVRERRGDLRWDEEGENGGNGRGSQEIMCKNGMGEGGGKMCLDGSGLRNGGMDTGERKSGEEERSRNGRINGKG